MLTVTETHFLKMSRKHRQKHLTVRDNPRHNWHEKKQSPADVLLLLILLGARSLTRGAVSTDDTQAFLRQH